MANVTLTDIADLPAGAVLRDVSADGRFVSYATGDTLFLKDLQTGNIETIATFPDVVLPGGITQSFNVAGGDLSADGAFILYSRELGSVTGPPPLPADPPDELFLKNLQTGQITPIVTEADGGNVRGQRLSADGRFVAYRFFDGTDEAVILHDRTTGTETFVTGVDDLSLRILDVSNDGRFVLFETPGPRSGETDRDLDVFLKDNQTGTLTKITDGGTSSDQCLSSDSRYVAFTDQDPGAGFDQAYVRDLANPFFADRLVSSAADGTPGNGDSFVTSMSADGTIVAFVSLASNLVAGDTNGVADLFVKNLVTGEVTRIGPYGLPTAGAPIFDDAELSADGSRLVFTTNVDFPSLGDTDGKNDIYAADISPRPILNIGVVADDNLINGIEAPSTTVTGTSNAVGRTVTVTIDGQFEGTGIVAADGTWAVNIDVQGVPDGPHTVEATVADKFGDTASDSQAVTVDTTPPLLDIASIGGDFVVSAAESLAPVLVTGTSDAIGATVELFADAKFAGTAVVQADGSWSLQVSATGLVGNEVFSARVADAAGNATIDVDIAFVDKSHAFASLSLAELDGSNGFRIDGIEVGDRSGFSVRSAGDVNGDGFDDVIIGAVGAGPFGGPFSEAGGQSYVVFGAAGGFAPSLDLAALDGSNGFRIDGEAGSVSGQSVSAGDINGDGFADLVVGATEGSPDGHLLAGETFVLFGHAGTFAPTIDVASLDGTNGFRLDGLDEGDRSGFSIASGGDVNGDGLADIVIGAYGAIPGGQSYVVFGQADGWAPSVDLATLDGANGFRIQGIDDGGASGEGVAMAGDANGDGFDDVLVWAGSGVYLVFGKGDWSTTPNIDLASIDGSNGVRLVWDGPGGNGAGGTFDPGAIASAGDINGDGFDDLIIGNSVAPGGGNTLSGESVIVFGKGAGWSSEFDLSAVDGSSGFRIDIASKGHGSGQSVASAGDLNGDGFDDFVVGAVPSRDEQFGSSPIDPTYVVYGKAGGWDASFDLGDLNGGNGFRLDGIDPFDFSSFAVASARDVNGDGFDDLIIGAPGADAAGNLRQEAGESYVIFGADFRGRDKTVTLDPITGDDRLTAGELTAAVAVSGTSDAIGDTVDILLDGAAVGSAVVAADGTWSTTIDASGLTPGRYHVRATATQDDGYTASDGAILTVPGAVAGKVIDGYISGATVFADANGNHVIDAGEFAAISDAGGAYALPGGEGFTLVAQGGTDIATRLALQGILLAPQGSEVITPLTTVVQYMIENEQLTQEQAVERVREMLEQAADRGPFFDSFEAFLGGDSGAGADIAGNARVAGAAALAAAALSALDGDGGVTTATALDAYLAALAHQFAANPLATLDDYDVLATVHETAEAIGFDLQQTSAEANAAEAAAAMILALLGGRGGSGGGGGGSSGGGAIESETEGLAGLDYLQMISAISLVAQGQATTDLAEAIGLILAPPPDPPFAAQALTADVPADVPADPLAAVVAAYSGDALREKIAAALLQLGDIDGPGFENAPDAAMDMFATDEDTPLVVGAKGVLANDGDADGDALSAVIVSGPAHGTLDLKSDGSFTYTPDGDFNGTDSFTYKANDGGLDSAAQTVSITVHAVNDSPVGANDSYAADEDTVLQIAAAGVLGNDKDADGNGLSAILVDGPQHGALTLNADGSFSYTPDANYNGADSFTYKANDGTVDGNIATVNLAIAAINDGPTAPVLNSVTTDEDEASAPIAIGAADIDGDTLAYSVKAGSGPALGTVSFQGGSFVYTPNANANGTDGFVIVIDDGHGGTIEQAVSVSVNAVADAAIIGGTTTGSVTEDGTLTTGGLLTIVDPDAGEAGFQAGSFKAAHGTLALDAAGAWSYTLDNADAAVQALNSGQSLTEVVTVRALDGTAQDISVEIRGADEGTGAIVGDDRANRLNGTAGDDVIEGRGGNDTVFAGDGDDRLVATVGDGVDFYFGGGGVDTLDLSAVSASVSVNLLGFAIGAQTGVDILSSIENAIGGKGGDQLFGNGGANLLIGGGGNDSIGAGGGNDTVVGGDGKDSLGGGSGNDVIALTSASFAAIDGGSGVDMIRLDGAGLTLDLTTIAQTAIRGIEQIDIGGSGNNMLILTAADLLDLSDSSNQLLVMGDVGDSVTRGAGWTTGAVVNIGGQDYQSFTAGQAVLLVDTDVTTMA